jgi:RNA polymerase sigma-70 factor (ECF subfamily)
MATDEQLVARLVDGDEAALRDLLRRYERPLSSFIFRHTGGRDVEDLYQETWWRVVRQGARFDPTRRFSTWLFQITVNLCRDWHRRLPPVTQPIADDVAAPDERQRSEAAVDAAALLAELPDVQREVIVLRYYHDFSEEQAAEILGCPKGTVKSRLHHALARLAARIREGER